MSTMLPLLRSLIPPLLSLTLLISASGFLNTFTSLRLDLEGYETQVIGAITSALYLGILVGSLTLSRFIEKWGHIHSFILFATISSALIVAQALWINSYYWAFLRLLGGLCMAGVFIVIESWLLMLSSPFLRGRVLSLYLAIFYAALSGGQLLIHLSSPLSNWPFFIAAALCILSLFPITLGKITAPKLEGPGLLSLKELFQISPLGFFGGVISGMLLAAVYGLVPVYGKEIGLSASDIGTLMAVLIFGGLGFQWPLGRWADRGYRRCVLNTTSFCTAFFSLAIASWSALPHPLLLFFAWCFGGFSFTIYPLSMSYVCEKIAQNQIIAATGGFVFSYGIGAIAGPLLAPLAMYLAGHAGLFYFFALITLLLGLTGLKKA